MHDYTWNVLSSRTYGLAVDDEYISHGGEVDAEIVIRQPLSFLLTHGTYLCEEFLQHLLTPAEL